jgi:dihydrofolate reductase
MRKLTVFNNVSLDGYFTGVNDDISWTYLSPRDPEFEAFTAENAKTGGELVFGRKTYQMMASYWPTPMALEQNPVVAERINALQKVVFSRTLDSVSWQNTRLVKDNLTDEILAMKQSSGKDLVIMGSGSLVSQLSQAHLIDVYQLVVNPVVIGNGRTLFEGMMENLQLKLTDSRIFNNGNIFLTYETT